MQLHNWQIGGILSSIGLGFGTMIGNLVGRIATVSETFGSMGAICSGILGAAGVMALGFKLYKKLDRIEMATDEIMPPRYQNGKYKEGTLRARFEESFVRGEENQVKLDRLLNHSSAQKDNVPHMMSQLSDGQRKMLEKEDVALAKLDEIATSPKQ